MGLKVTQHACARNAPELSQRYGSCSSVNGEYTIIVLIDIPPPAKCISAQEVANRVNEKIGGGDLEDREQKLSLKNIGNIIYNEEIWNNEVKKNITLCIITKNHVAYGYIGSNPVYFLVIDENDPHKQKYTYETIYEKCDELQVNGWDRNDFKDKTYIMICSDAFYQRKSKPTSVTIKKLHTLQRQHSDTFSQRKSNSHILANETHNLARKFSQPTEPRLETKFNFKDLINVLSQHISLLFMKKCLEIDNIMNIKEDPYLNELTELSKMNSELLDSNTTIEKKKDAIRAKRKQMDIRYLPDVLGEIGVSMTTRQAQLTSSISKVGLWPEQIKPDEEVMFYGNSPIMVLAALLPTNINTLNYSRHRERVRQ